MKKIREMSYSDQNHVYGRIWGYTAAAVLTSYPIIVALIFNAWPTASEVFKGLLGVIPIFWTAGVVEVLTYIPMLGAVSGGYLGFVTGNLSNLKVPCALSCMEGAKVKSGTPEGDVIATISTAVSSIVTIFIIIIGVAFLVPFSAQISSNTTLKTATDYIIPALFGSLGVVYVSKNWKIALPPVILMVVLFIAIPALSGLSSVMIPVCAVFTIVVARIMYKKGLLTAPIATLPYHATTAEDVVEAKENTAKIALDAVKEDAEVVSEDKLAVTENEDMNENKDLSK